MRTRAYISSTCLLALTIFYCFPVTMGPYVKYHIFTERLVIGITWFLVACSVLILISKTSQDPSLQKSYNDLLTDYQIKNMPAFMDHIYYILGFLSFLAAGHWLLAIAELLIASVDIGMRKDAEKLGM